VLTQFEAAGIVERHHFESGHSVFELRDDTHHDHIVCTSCGKVVEFKDEMIEERQRKMAESLGFALTDHSLNLYGVCAACLRAADTPRK
jgi:Fur family ferric uptake transcriptional regulator